MAQFPECPEPQLRDCFPKVFLPSVVLFAVRGEKEIQGFAMLCTVALTHSCQLHMSCAVPNFRGRRLQPGDITRRLSPLLNWSCHALQKYQANSHVLPLLTRPFSFQLHPDAIPGSSLTREIPCSLQCCYKTVFLLPASHTPLVKPCNVCWGTQTYLHLGWNSKTISEPPVNAEVTAS